MVLTHGKIAIIVGVAILGAMIGLFTSINLVTQPPTKQEDAINRVHESNDKLFFTKLNISDDTTLTWGNPALVDFNSDGYLDIVLSNHIDTPHFYKNNADATFSDIYDSTGIIQEIPEGKGHEFATWGYKDQHGFAWGDYNNDGILDLYIAMGACEGTCFEEKFDYLYEGNGEGKFRDITSTAGTMNVNGRARSASWIDYDNDGYLDLFVINMWSDSVLYHNNGDGTFTDVTAVTGL
ncbi:MAG: FG-GAP repeat domain-containing protein, partial [Nitrososphaerales archaeon]